MDDIIEHIRHEIGANEVMLYMKGTPDFPRCGFSAAVVQVLEELGVEFGSADVLSSDELRVGIKSFSDWPTIPQLYVKGELVGGCDIVREMYQSGELAELLVSHNIAHAG